MGVLFLNSHFKRGQKEGSFKQQNLERDLLQYAQPPSDLANGYKFSTSVVFY